MLRKEYITTKQAADLLGFSKTHIIRLINSGEVEAKMIDGQYFINKNSIGILRSLTKRDLAIPRGSMEYG